jgi:hypothetical protein
MKKIYIRDDSHTLSVDDLPSQTNPDVRWVHRFPPRERSYWVRPGPPRKKRPR